MSCASAVSSARLAGADGGNAGRVRAGDHLGRRQAGEQRRDPGGQGLVAGGLGPAPAAGASPAAVSAGSWAGTAASLTQPSAAW